MPHKPVYVWSLQIVVDDDAMASVKVRWASGPPPAFLRLASDRMELDVTAVRPFLGFPGHCGRANHAKTEGLADIEDAYWQEHGFCIA